MQRSFVHNTIGDHFAYETVESIYSRGLLTGIEHEKCVDGIVFFFPFLPAVSRRKKNNSSFTFKAKFV